MSLVPTTHPGEFVWGGHINKTHRCSFSFQMLLKLNHTNFTILFCFLSLRANGSLMSPHVQLSQGPPQLTRLHNGQHRVTLQQRERPGNYGNNGTLSQHLLPSNTSGCRTTFNIVTFTTKHHFYSSFLLSQPDLSSQYLQYRNIPTKWKFLSFEETKDTSNTWTVITKGVCPLFRFLEGFTSDMSGSFVLLFMNYFHTSSLRSSEKPINIEFVLLSFAKDKISQFLGHKCLKSTANLSKRPRVAFSTELFFVLSHKIPW